MLRSKHITSWFKNANIKIIPALLFIYLLYYTIFSFVYLFILKYVFSDAIAWINDHSKPFPQKRLGYFALYLQLKAAVLFLFYFVTGLLIVWFNKRVYVREFIISCLLIAMIFTIATSIENLMKHTATIAKKPLAEAIY